MHKPRVNSSRISEFNLDNQNIDGYLKLRNKYYNLTPEIEVYCHEIEICSDLLKNFQFGLSNYRKILTNTSYLRLLDISDVSNRKNEKTIINYLK